MSPLTQFIGASVGTNAMAVVVTVVALRTDIKWIKEALRRSEGEIDVLRSQVVAADRKAEAAHRRLDVVESRQCSGPI